ncbi:transmembrane protein 244-like isoform X2 [Xenopus laevis]|uniref:Transmembrane protein 244-like isoform X2 n=1 Tax=Xenopus laevis TaxID=8355 RepID=A0A8J1KRK9_XENLA|nr:transmembrane protein 244-like isoform X2 [Xenopus laevis]
MEAQGKRCKKAIFIQIYIMGLPLSLPLHLSQNNFQIVLQNLLICAAVFYTVFYLLHIICFIALGLDSFDELGPFDFKENPSWLNKKYLANLISLEVTFTICGLIFALLVEEWIWDYACTITLIHVIITSLVKMEFPLEAHWWTSLGIGLTAMICEGQILAYLLFRHNFIYPVLDDF